MIEAVAVDHQSTRVATGCWDGTAKVWDGATGSLLRAFGRTVQKMPSIEMATKITSITFSTAGDLLVTSSRDKRVNVWDVSGGTLLKTLEVDYAISMVRISHDTSQLVTYAESFEKRLANFWDISNLLDTSHNSNNNQPNNRPAVQVIDAHGQPRQTSSRKFWQISKLMAKKSTSEKAQIQASALNKTDTKAGVRNGLTANIDWTNYAVWLDEEGWVRLLRPREERGIVLGWLAPKHRGFRIQANKEVIAVFSDAYDDSMRATFIKGWMPRVGDASG